MNKEADFSSFWALLGAFWGAFWIPKSIKNRIEFQVRFLVAFSVAPGRPNVQKVGFSLRWLLKIEGRPLRPGADFQWIWVLFWSSFGVIFEAFFHCFFKVCSEVRFWSQKRQWLIHME